MSKKNKKDEKKVGYSISEPTNIIEEKGKFNIENEGTKFLVILLCIIAFIAVLWLVNNLRNNKEEEKEEKAATIDYTEVLVGNMLNQKYDKYVVYAYNNEENSNKATIEFLLANAEHYYKLNLDKANNLPAVAETSNFKGSLEEIRFKGLTLLIIEKGKITGSYEGAEAIIEYLRTLNS